MEGKNDFNKWKKAENIYRQQKNKGCLRGGVKVYSAGNICTYHVDSGQVYAEEIDEGVSCLAPKTFTPAKSGWTFVGWRQDTAANGSVLSVLVMGASPITLYAVFRQTITLSYTGNGNTGGYTAAQTGTRYWNTGNVSNPSFTLQVNGFTRSGYTFCAWAAGSAGGTQYSAGASITLSANTTMYAVWVQTITNFAYTGGQQTFVVPQTGLYLLTCLGAGGGNAFNSSYSEIATGGAGGKTTQYIRLNKGQTLYIVCGGAGDGSGGKGNMPGGYNGGGTSGNSGAAMGYPGSGGGATHIATSGGLLSAVPLANLICVAGGGGGGGAKGGTCTAGGAGGGISGGTGIAGTYEGGAGGTQSSGYAYGQGGNATGAYAGGGGGGLYGGRGGAQSAGGGGGSGYVMSATTAHNGAAYTNTTTIGGGASRKTSGSASIQFIAA